MTATVGADAAAIGADGGPGLLTGSAALRDAGVERDAGAPPDEAVPARTRWPDAGIGVLVAGLLGFIAARPLSDNSFLTHLATGRLMLDGSMPTTNPFLYSSSEFPIPSWLWSAVLGVVDAG
ncbi:MAG TPA: hypothetical protein PLS63_08940, partial [Microthrixaceae bacterium]|nr:hypothetical protein [Microthrixaceae bacterium]